MNTERLLALADHIENLPDGQGFNMGTFGSHNDVDYRGHICDTAACIAGYAILLFGDDEAKADLFCISSSHVSPAHHATNILQANTHKERAALEQLFYAVHRIYTPADAVAALRALAVEYAE